MDPHARRVLALFARHEQITVPLVARELAISDRTARDLVKGWVSDGWLVVANASNRAHAYGLSAVHRRLIGELSAVPTESH